jgi:hypothetical protein
MPEREILRLFDLFGIDVDSYPGTYLLSESDVRPRTPIVSALGTLFVGVRDLRCWFPQLTFKVELCLDQATATLTKVTLAIGSTVQLMRVRLTD